MPLQNIERVKWEDVRERVFTLNKDVATEIDVIPAAEHPPLYLARYPFGELIIEEGVMRFPFEGSLRLITDPALPNEIAADLGYEPFPMLMSLNKTLELFLTLSERTHPLHLFYPGKILGVWPVLDKHPSAFLYSQKMWSLASGARTIFLLPKILDSGSHSKMQRQLQLEEIYPPHNLFDQGLVFKEIAASPKMKSNWQNEVLIFSKDWMEKLKENHWPALRHVLLQQEWDSSLYLRNHLQLEAMWQILANAQAETHLRPNAYVIDTVKHLFSIASNAVLGFAPLTTPADETIAPIRCIQEAYLEYYGLKLYIPTILAPAYIQDRPAVYYSFLYPTLLSLSPNHNFRNTLEDERNIKYMVELFKSKLLGDPRYQNKFLEDIQFHFFHFEEDPIHNILALNQLTRFDPFLSRFSPGKDLVFSENGPYLRACVRISMPKASDSSS